MEPVKTAPELERKLVAILAADVQGYTRHMERDEVATLRVLSSHRLIIDKAIDRFDGRITSSAGDSVMAEFSSVLNAVECAVQIQEALAVENAQMAQELAMSFRIGINVGDVMVKGSNIFGDGVNVAARLETLSEPGGVCVSRGVRDYVDKQSAFQFLDLGEQRVKNIAEPVRAYKILFKDGQAQLNAAAFDAQPETDYLGHSNSDDVALELAFWSSVKDSETIEELEAYLKQFPRGTFNDLAKIRIKELGEND